MTTHPLPPLSDELADVLDGEYGTPDIDTGIDHLRDGIRRLAETPLTLRQTQSVLAALTAIDGCDVLTGLALLVGRLTDPTTKPALGALPLDLQKEIQRNGEEYARLTADYAPRHLINDALAAIDTT